VSAEIGWQRDGDSRQPSMTSVYAVQTAVDSGSKLLIFVLRAAHRRDQELTENHQVEARGGTGGADRLPGSVSDALENRLPPQPTRSIIGQITHQLAHMAEMRYAIDELGRDQYLRRNALWTLSCCTSGRFTISC
jgi:hypothetical protein